MQSTATFLGLPEEILIHTLAELGLQDLLNCSLVCKSLHLTIQDCLLLQYHIELHAAGLIECNVGTLTTAERLARLQKHMSGWRTLRYAHREEILLPLLTGSTYELYGGVFARGLATTGQFRGTDGLHFTELPSALTGKPLKQWTREDFGLVFSDFTMIPEEDLIVCIEKRPATEPKANFTVHCRTLSSNSPHPLSSHPILQHACHDTRLVLTHQVSYTYGIQVCGDLLAVLFVPHPLEMAYMEDHVAEELVIWNWKTGAVQLTLVLPDSRSQTFSFLSPSSFLLGKLTDSTARVDVYLLDPSLPAGHALAAEFEFPHVRLGDVAYDNIVSRSDPSPSSSNGELRGNSNAMFLPSPSARLFCFSLRLDTEPEIDELTVFTLASTLLKPVQDLQVAIKANPNLLRYHRPPRIPWSSWSHSARLLEQGHVPEGHVCFIYGYRWITCTPYADGPFRTGIKCRIKVCDFNPYLVRRASCEPPPAEETQMQRSPTGARGRFRSILRHIVRLPNLIEVPGIFVDKRVASSLPYIAVESEEVFAMPSALFIDGERICLLTSRPDPYDRSWRREALDIMAF